MQDCYGFVISAHLKAAVQGSILRWKEQANGGLEADLKVDLNGCCGHMLTVFCPLEARKRNKISEEIIKILCAPN